MHIMSNRCCSQRVVTSRLARVTLLIYATTTIYVYIYIYIYMYTYICMYIYIYIYIQ